MRQIKRHRFAIEFLLALVLFTVAAGAKAVEVIDHNGQPAINWCVRTVVVDAQGFSDIQRICGIWSLDGRLLSPSTGE